MRRLAIALVGLGAVAFLVGAISAGRAGAESATTAVTAGAAETPAAGSTAGTTPKVDVVQASGLLDDVLAHQIEQSIADAESDTAQALIIQLNSKGSVVSRGRAARLAERIANAKVPVAIWVGPAGSRAVGVPGQLLAVAAATGIAPGSRVGHSGEPLVLSSGPLDLGSTGTALKSRTAGASEARDLGLVRNPLNEPTVPALRQMVFAIDGLSWQGSTVDTVDRIVASDGTARNDLTSPVRLTKLGLVAQLFHTVSSPPVAYLLTIVGLGLLLFEFFTAGVGVAGVVGAVCLVLGCFGIAALPVRGWAYALLLVSMFAFAIDVQTGVPRLWTWIGVVCFVVASLFLYRGLSLSWVALATGIGGVLLTYFSGMPSMVRTRFATPTIGREWMIGTMGEAVTWVDPVGVVQIGEGKWRARTNRATPIEAGGSVRVVAIDGVTLEVEPEQGAARDYRERRGDRIDATTPADVIDNADTNS